MPVIMFITTKDSMVKKSSLDATFSTCNIHSFLYPPPLHLSSSYIFIVYKYTDENLFCKTSSNAKKKTNREKKNRNIKI